MESKEDINYYKKLKSIDDKVFECLNKLLFRNNFYTKEEKIIKELDVIVKINLYNHFDSESLGFIEYVYTKADNSLLINHLNRYAKDALKLRVNEKVFITLTELFIYKLIVDNFNLDYIYLYAMPDSKNVGQEFCLMCYYEKLGFTQYDKKEYKKVIKYCQEQLKTYYKNLSKQDRQELEIDLKNKRKMCLLCKCQKAKIDLNSYENFGILSVEMKYIIENIEKTLNDIYSKIC